MKVLSFHHEGLERSQSLKEMMHFLLGVFKDLHKELMSFLLNAFLNAPFNSEQLGED
jgi:hypothetical protein